MNTTSPADTGSGHHAHVRFELPVPSHKIYEPKWAREDYNDDQMWYTLQDAHNLHSQLLHDASDFVLKNKKRASLCLGMLSRLDNECHSCRLNQYPDQECRPPAQEPIVSGGRTEPGAENRSGENTHEQEEEEEAEEKPLTVISELPHLLAKNLQKFLYKDDNDVAIPKNNNSDADSPSDQVTAGTKEQPFASQAPHEGDDNPDITMTILGLERILLSLLQCHREEHQLQLERARHKHNKTIGWSSFLFWQPPPRSNGHGTTNHSSVGVTRTHTYDSAAAEMFAVALAQALAVSVGGDSVDDDSNQSRQKQQQ